MDLSQLAQNYDLTLYDDIGAAFSAPASTTDLNTLGAEQSGNAYSPSIYSPSIYSPSIYSPSIYSPSIYSPSIYSPSIYSPSIYSPSIYSPSIYSPSIYSPSIYSPSIYSPSIYSPVDCVPAGLLECADPQPDRDLRPGRHRAGDHQRGDLEQQRLLLRTSRRAQRRLLARLRSGSTSASPADPAPASR